jgi:hypothetical protein
MSFSYQQPTGNPFERSPMAWQRATLFQIEQTNMRGRAVDDWEDAMWAVFEAAEAMRA